jgi:gamma-glutamylcyclotransferase (GGCT)/AIG2-like uncharacterized protein YtfP
MARVSTVAEPDRLFAYGTLMAGFGRRPLLGPATLEGRARLRGTLYDLGEFPGLVLEGFGWVVGELYHVPDLAARLPRLDREEGYDPARPGRSLYVRRAVAVELAGTTRAAWAYTFNREAGRAALSGPRVESGDWRAHRARRAPIPRSAGPAGAPGLPHPPCTAPGGA